jgi:hypothetical protein
VTSIKKGDSDYQNSVISQQRVNKEKVINEQQRSKRYTTPNRPEKTIENKKKAFEETLKKDNKDSSHRLRKICGKCSPCCCLASTLGAILLILGLAALIVSLILLLKNGSTSSMII